MKCTDHVTDIFLIFFNTFRIARGVFTTLSNIYDGAFLQNSYWTPSIVPMLYKTFQKKVVFFMSGVLNGVKTLLLHEIGAILFPCLKHPCLNSLFALIFIRLVVKGVRKFLATGSTLKMLLNAFYFTLKSFFVLKLFKFLSINFVFTFWS